MCVMLRWMQTGGKCLANENQKKKPLVKDQGCMNVFCAVSIIRIKAAVI